MWQDWVNVVLGLVVFALAFIGVNGAALSWTLGIVGAVIAIVGFWGATSLSAPERRFQ